MENSINISTIKDFVISNGFTQIVPIVRSNVNDYHYLTFINADNQATNVYFSISESEKITEGEVLDKSYIKELKVAHVTNADGEMRNEIF